VGYHRGDDAVSGKNDVRNNRTIETVVLTKFDMDPKGE
jgi:hypothetical protein